MLFYAISVINVDADSKDLEPWETLKTGIKNNETVKYLDNEVTTLKFDESKENEFVIKLEKKTDDVTYRVPLKYENGVVSYNTPVDEPKEFELLNSLVLSGLLQEVANLFDYEEETFFSWIDENSDHLSLADNGIEMTQKAVNYENEYGNLSGSYIDSLKIRITEPITGYNNPAIKDENNPETGDINIIAFTTIAIICAGFVVISHHKAKSN